MTDKKKAEESVEPAGGPVEENTPTGYWEKPVPLEEVYPPYPEN